MARAVGGVIKHGGAGPDTLVGTEGADTLMGYEGDDLLQGLGGNDKLYGHEGNDRLEGGAGNDTLHGNEGNDTLLGGGGDDFLAGQEGDDTVDGGEGNDVLGWGGTGHDILSGGSGADRFYSGAWSWTQQQVGTVRIEDFETGVDILDLTRFDANESTAPGVIKGKNTPGNEAFTVVGSTDGVTAGHLVISTGLDALGQPITIVRGYTNTTMGHDIEIILSGAIGDNPVITAQDIWL
ncbi:MAG: hypothetical protein H0V46_02815 [Sphingomonas sp.]|nr:hypothetical protein [Sphingomonas sp.]